MSNAKLLLLLIAIFLLNTDFLLSYPAFADVVSGTDGTEFTSRFNFTGNFSRASNPDCGAFRTASALAGIAIAVGTIFTGVILIISSAGLSTGLVIIAMIAVIVGVWKAIGGLVICEHSFVRHPVARDYNGDYKDFTLRDTNYTTLINKNFQTEDEYLSLLKEKSGKDGKQTEKEVLDFNNWEVVSVDREHYYWPKNGVQYSEYIEVCHRNPLTFGNLFKINNFDSREKFGYIDFDVREKDIGYVDGSWSPKVDGGLKCEVLKVGQSKTIHGSTFKAVGKASRLCVELAEINTLGIKMTPWPQGVDIGCTELPPDPIAPMCDKSMIKFSTGNPVAIGPDEDYKAIIKNSEKEGKIFIGYDNKGCFQDYISQACYNQAGSKSLVPIPITSMVVQCIKESLDNLVAGRGLPNSESFISLAQKKMKNAVTAVLVLALMLFSVKAISGEVRSLQEIYILIIKFALVIYFTTGSTMSHYYRELTVLSDSLSEIVLKASSESKNICNYKPEKYGESAYLAPWDRLDCRILFYLGAPLDGITGKVGTGGVGILSVLLGAAPVLLISGSIIGIILAGGQILTALVCIFMAVMMMIIVLWMCYIFILSLIALSVIIILSPLFIPMVLFQHTKGYFDGWLKELITYSLYPVMLFTFLSFMFIACDKTYFKNLNFEKEEITILNNKKQWFKLRDRECDRNKDTLACMMQNYSFKKNSILGLFDFTYIEFSTSLIGELLKLALILFLFYHFLNILPNMAAELAGNPRSALGSGAIPEKMMSKAFSATKAVVGAISKAQFGDVARIPEQGKKSTESTMSRVDDQNISRPTLANDGANIAESIGKDITDTVK
ncbi:conjugal transfer protein TraH [Wolbachia endosymbiont of Cruorifilaria tuberocauda]|uniref:type IV secretion system protein n=1 Tax=Wolbachia endosymbiont of Cruorifilaria tuberocauda TaxID=1812111 RepID=UPI00158F28BB|nr:type IV secretion system protein [Wolbachia endosymbiont of Cruorifilaria tuberocauda]QKX01382.1 conjugal transfer protein TraH [Wolbachia endosymbiont of Cruorifilaria tuberocauda]